MSSGLIYKKIAAAMSEIGAVSKDRNNEQQGFKFRGIDDIINEIRPALKKHGIFIVPEVLEEKREERPTKSGGVMTYVILKVKYSFFAEDGSSISATMVGEGSDTGDKASNKAQSIALKYACLQVLAIPTEDEKDPDAESPEFAPRPAPVKPQPSTQPRPQAAAMNPPARKTAPVPAPAAGDFVCTFGQKYKGMTVRQIVEKDGQPELERFIDWLEDNAAKKGLPLSFDARALKANAEAYFDEMKMQRQAPDESWKNEEFPS